jgi:Bacterial regulatory proteins, tetR family
MLSTRLPCVSLSLAGARRSEVSGWAGPTAAGICATPGSADAVGVEAQGASAQLAARSATVAGSPCHDPAGDSDPPSPTAQPNTRWWSASIAYRNRPSPLRSSSRRRGRASRERIVERAADLFAERGIAGSSVDEVLAAAKAGKGQFYRYFRNRDELAAATVGYRRA